MVRIRLPKRNSRAGVILAAVLATLLVAMLFGAQLTRAVVAHHRRARLSEQQQQSFWLAESAVQRALLGLAKSADYRGETWRVPEDVFGAGKPGVAVIRVESTTEPQAGRMIRVQAQYPADPVLRSLYERELFVKLPSPGGSS